KQRIAAGEPLSEPELKDMWKDLTDFLGTDGFNDFRTDRTIAAMVAEDPERWTPKAAIEAIRFRTGDLFTTARRRADGEKGLSVLTGWLFMPLRLYPEGEQVQRGLDSIYRAARDIGPDAIDNFFEKHPEYRVRRISVLDRDDPEGQLREADTALFFMDLAQIQERYEPELDRLRGLVREAETVGYLQTKEGRRLLKIIDGDVDWLLQRQDEEIGVLEGLYPQRQVELSLRASPRERALFELRDEFFQIKRGDFTSNALFFQARDKFLANLPNDVVEDGDWLQLAVRSVGIWTSFGDRASGAEREAAGRIVGQREDVLRGLTTQARGMVSRSQF
ncbi:hypothetical protein LCGC14_2665480, partial [marine sediment metagenome]